MLYILCNYITQAAGSLRSNAGTFSPPTTQTQTNTMKEQIKSSDTMAEAIYKVACGNPGATTVLMRCLTEYSQVDPDSGLGGLSALLRFDSLDIRGPKVWMLYKDVCKCDLPTMIMLLRANQLGFISAAMLERGIDNYGEGLDIDELCVKVKERLPNFKIDSPKPVEKITTSPAKPATTISVPMTKIKVITTKEQDHDRKHGGGVKQLEPCQVHENNHQEIHRHLSVAKLMSDDSTFRNKRAHHWYIGTVMQLHGQNMNPRKLLRKMRKAA